MAGFLKILPERARRLVRAVGSTLRLALRDPRSFLLSVRMGTWIVVVSMVAPRVSLPALFRLTETRSRWSGSARREPAEIAQAIDRILNAGLVTDGSCWKRTAVLRRYLQLNAIETDVVFGLRRGSSGDLDGHAWLERDGAPFLERESPHGYTVTFRYPQR